MKNQTKPTDDHGTEVVWKCPNCGWKNIDDKELTAVPMCFACQKDIHWDEIEKLSD